MSKLKQQIRERLRKRIIEYKKQFKCADCGSKYPHWVMEFDHLHSKVDNISRLVRRYSWPIIVAELKKCDVVCSNCHANRTYLRRNGKAVP